MVHPIINLKMCCVDIVCYDSDLHWTWSIKLQMVLGRKVSQSNFCGMSRRLFPRNALVSSFGNENHFFKDQRSHIVLHIIQSVTNTYTSCYSIHV